MKLKALLRKKISDAGKSAVIWIVEQETGRTISGESYTAPETRLSSLVNTINIDITRLP